MRNSGLAAQIEADIIGRETSRHNIVPCRVCAHAFIYRGRRGDLNGNFCSLHCQSWYDDGKPEIDHNPTATASKTPLTGRRVVAGPPDLEVGSLYYESIFPKLTPMNGYRIKCANCSKEFESKGLRCCSAECERRYRDREFNIAVMAEVGIEAKAKRKCANPDCSNTIPKWRNRRQVSSATRFCSPRCSRKVNLTLKAAA